MAVEVKVPSVGESITSGILASWRVKDGDYVERDQPIFDLETDKITSEGLAESNGRISLKAEEGEEVEIGQVVAEIDDSVESGDGDSREREASQPRESRRPETRDEDSSEDDEPQHALSPAARRAAEELNVNTSRIKGSGKDGRVTKGDVEAAAKSREDGEKESASKPEDERPAEPSGEEAPARPAEVPAPAARRTTRKKLSPLRRRIAERLVASQRDTATLTTFNEVDLSSVKNLRGRHQDSFVDKHGIKLGFMSFFVKATVHALKEVPAVNAQLDGDTHVQNHFYDISVAVSTDKGLLVPVIRDCDRIGYAEIERRIADVAKRAKEGKIQLEELEGGVFTITNGGIFGSVLSTPVINPPQSAILGMHSIQDRPVALNGEIVIRPMMQLALSYDHRLIDGREAVTFLRKIKEALEEPTRILLEV